MTPASTAASAVAFSVAEFGKPIVIRHSNRPFSVLKFVTSVERLKIWRPETNIIKLLRRDWQGWKLHHGFDTEILHYACILKHFDKLLNIFNQSECVKIMRSKNFFIEFGRYSGNFKDMWSNPSKIIILHANLIEKVYFCLKRPLIYQKRPGIAHLEIWLKC